MKIKDRVVIIKIMYYVCIIKIVSKRLVYLLLKFFCVMGTLNSRFMEMIMLVVGNSEFLIIFFIIFELISCWG